MADADRDKRRNKQLKRMTKILSSVWQLPQSDPFQECSNAPPKKSKADDQIYDLTSIGQKVDDHGYQLGKHGWADFARDLGGVYNRHIHRKSKHANAAKKHLEEVKALLSKDPSLAKLAADHVPPGDFVTVPSNRNNKAGGGGSNKKHNNNKNHDKGSNNHKDNKKRKGATSSSNLSLSKAEKLLEQARKGTADLTLGERQEKALAALATFVEENNGSKDQISSFRAQVKRSKKNTSNVHEMYDIHFFNDGGRRFRSMMEIGEFLDLVRQPKKIKTGGGGGGGRSHHHHSRQRVANTKEALAEKRKLRKELEKLRKEHEKATKKLDDFLNEQEESRYPVEDLWLLEEEHNQQQSQQQQIQQKEHEQHDPTLLRSLALKAYARKKCAATLSPDIDSFPSLQPYCIPDLIMVWDFLCTFSRVLSLNPIPLDDFANALCYSPPEQVQGDDVLSPPIFLAEAHLALLKLLFHDRSSDEWWWSILETEETENPNSKFLKGQADVADEIDMDVDGECDVNMNEDNAEDGQDSKKRNEIAPIIKIDIAALLAEPEDPLITTSWLQALEDIRLFRKKQKQDKKQKQQPKKETKDSSGSISTVADFKNAVKTAKALVANKWVLAYLRKVLGLIKNDVMSAKKAIVWLMDRFQDARPDLWDRNVRQDTIFKKRAEVVEEVSQQMEKLNNAVAVVTDEDVLSDAESDEEDSDDEDDDEIDDINNIANTKKEHEADDSERPSGVIPPRPLPALVDLLLPPAKPGHNAEFLNPFTWPHMAGATARRVLHRFKRLRNEVDDSIREAHQLPILTVSQRRQREAMTGSRVLSECAADIEDEEGKKNPFTQAIEHLCSGRDYLELSTLERLCVLRLLVEAAYDTDRVYLVVDGNFKQRLNAMKALEVEQRKAKSEAKKKITNDEKAARKKLAMEERNKFLDEKRAEIRKIHEGSNEYNEEFVESLTDEDIIEFDEDIKADYEALPGPETFSKNEVSKMVVRMQEEAAFETHTLRVLTMEEIIERDKGELEEMEAQLQSLGGVDPDEDASIDRETSRSIERLRRDIEKVHQMAETLPADREAAMEALRDAIADGTIKVLKNALRQAKQAKLSGPDIETGGVWSLGLMRDAALELENAKTNKRVADAQKELVAKRNKCFIRSEPLGQDRFRNRFWHFDYDEYGHVWVEAKIMLREDGSKDNESASVPSGYLDLLRDDCKSIAIGAEDVEDDLDDSEDFRIFSRREYHPSGRTPTLVKYKWGCHATEKSLRALMKNLDSRGIREDELKANLKQSLEEAGGTGEKQDSSNSNEKIESNDNTNSIAEGKGVVVDEEAKLQTSGDETVFRVAVDAEKDSHRNGIIMDVLERLSSAIGERVRVRHVVDESKEPPVARYEEGTIIGWKIRHDETVVERDSMMNGGDNGEHVLEDEHDRDLVTKVVDVPVWRASTNRGRSYWLTGSELMESLCRFSRWNSGDKAYFEYDAAFFAYRNSLGRHCGKAAEAAFASSPMFFARMMVKREQDLYAKLKNRIYDNNWGGKSGARAAWTTSMKDYTFDFQSARDGLLTMENAFFELTGFLDGNDQIVEEKDMPNGRELLDNPTTREDIELESLDKEIRGLWNSLESRAIFLEIVNSCTTTGFLSLALDLLCRNTLAYINAHKLLNVRNETTFSTRTTRRMNAWQQAQHAQQQWS